MMISGSVCFSETQLASRHGLFRNVPVPRVVGRIEFVSLGRCGAGQGGQGMKNDPGLFEVFQIQGTC